MVGSKRSSIFDDRIDLGRGWMNRKGRWFDTISMAMISSGVFGGYFFLCRDIVLLPILVYLA